MAGWWMTEGLGLLLDSWALSTEEHPGVSHQIASSSDVTLQANKTGLPQGKHHERKEWEEAQRWRTTVCAGETLQATLGNAQAMQSRSKWWDNGSDADFIRSEMWYRAKYSPV